MRLVDLLDEAVDRARAAIAERNPDLEGEEADAVAAAVGIGAIKYADLSSDRVKDYVLDFDRMLAFEGNTGPYLQYAHARIRSIFRRGEVDAGGPRRRRPGAGRAGRSGPWPWPCSASRGRCATRRAPASPTASAPTCSTWPRPSPPSTRPARC